MSEKINYPFTPIPNYFHDHGWFKDVNCLIFVNWAFHRCSTISRKIFHDHKEVSLDPFEFISGRDICSLESGLSHQQIRTQLLHLVEAGIIEKSTSKSTNKFSVYKWITTRFSENINQQINQQVTSNQPASNHNQDQRREDRLIDNDLIDAGDVAEFDLIFKHKKLGSIGIMKESLICDLEDSCTTRKIVEQAIEKMIKQDPILNGTIENYLKIVIEQVKKGKNLCPKPHHSQKILKIKSTNDKGYFLGDDLSEAPLAKSARLRGLK
jgi:hypothetical protein